VVPLLLAALFVAGVGAAAAGEWVLAGLVVVAGVAGVGAARRPELVLAAWIALGPWGAYALRWPWERSLVTFDRVLVAIAVVGLLARARRLGTLRPPGTFECLWLCYAAVAIGNALLLSTEQAFALRIAVDGFVLPALLFWAVRLGLDLERGGRALFWAAVALALSLPWLGLVEFVTRADLLPWKASSILRDDVVRANGPFSNDNAYSIVSALVAVFLAWLPSALHARLDRPARLAWIAAQGAGLLAALLPLFRAVMGALAIAYALPYLAAGRVRTLARAGVALVLVAVALSPLLLAASGTRAFRNRIADPSSAFSRAATYLAAVEIIRDHPVFGVGLASYRDAFDRRYGTKWYVDVEEVSGEGAENSPHNNVLGTWAELGVLGLAFYLAAAVVLAAEAWRRRSIAAAALMAVYWVPAMTLQTSIYPEITLIYFATLAVVLGRPDVAARPPEGRADA
jgi:hypothetical protein